MQIQPVNNTNNQSFGHSFRVSISAKDKNGVLSFVNPAKDFALYKQLNSKLVNWLNEDYYTNLRNVYGIKRKTTKVQPNTQKHRELIDKLKQLDDDYAGFNVVRSVYRRNQLGYITTGADVSMIENIKGLKQIGVAKSDSYHTNGNTHSDFVKDLCKAVKNGVLDYVQNDSILLRSPNNKEIMLRAIFTPAEKSKSGKIRYELDDFEFHENKTKRTLNSVDEKILRLKQSKGMREEIKTTVQNHLNRILGKKVHFSDIDEFLKPKKN